MRSYDKIDLNHAEAAVRRAELFLDSMKFNKKQAIENGNYRNTAKNSVHNGKIGNCYDINVWIAQESLKKAKEHLAEVKKNQKKPEKQTKVKEKKHESSSISYNRNSRKYSNISNNSESSYFDYENTDNNNTRNNEGCLKALGCCLKVLFFPYYILWLLIKWCIKKVKS